jgi:hypothetical protein
MSTPAFGAQPEPPGDAAQPDWLEAARQAFVWRYFYDDCGRSDPGKCGPDLRGRAVELARRDARVSEAA